LLLEQSTASLFPKLLSVFNSRGEATTTPAAARVTKERNETINSVWSDSEMTVSSETLVREGGCLGSPNVGFYRTRAVSPVGMVGVTLVGARYMEATRMY